ncbi:ClpP/crotonase-like domain-containing protein [Halenospora varia]|nr:ClpP/crotonase-like domain-containing protein [Halenospora varia]
MSRESLTSPVPFTLDNPVFASYTLTRTGCPVLKFKTLSSSSNSSSRTRIKMPSKSSLTPTFSGPPPTLPSTILLSFPEPSILLITLNRPKDLNCISIPMHYALHSLYTWYDAEPSLRIAVLTGIGRAFCAGADLKEWHSDNTPSKSNTPASPSTNKEDPEGVERDRTIPLSGFGALSRRGGKKPVICAVNGICFGGGCEMIINADLVIASSTAVFGLPEAKIGVVALAGALTRLVRTVGRQRAMEMALTGRPLVAEEAREWGLVNHVVMVERDIEQAEISRRVVEKAIEVAKVIAGNSPDSVIVSREGVKLGWEGVGAEEGTRLLMENWYRRMDKGVNMREGVASFVEKRKPKWVARQLQSRQGTPSRPALDGQLCVVCVVDTLVFATEKTI